MDALLHNQIRQASKRAVLAFPRLRPIATRGSGYGGVSGDNGNGLSNGTHLGGTSFLKYEVLRKCSEIRLRFGNFYWDSDGQHPGLNNISVRAGVQNPTYPATLGLPVYFAGRRDVTLEPGTVIDSDPIGITVDAGTVLGVPTRVAVASGEKFPRNVRAFAGRQEGHNYAAPIGADLTTDYSVPASVDTHVYGPLAVIAAYIDPATSRRCVALIGDSIIDGFSDGGFNPGWAARALGPLDIPYVQAGVGGLRADQFVVPNLDNHIYRAIDGCTDAFVLFGSNDINQGKTAAEVETALGELYEGLTRHEMRVHACTIPPITGSSDGQTIDTAKNNVRIAVNTWIRNGPTNVASVLELADAVEPSRNLGAFIPGYCTDSIHPNFTGYAAMADAVPDALLAALAA